MANDAAVTRRAPTTPGPSLRAPLLLLLLLLPLLPELVPFVEFALAAPLAV